MLKKILLCLRWIASPLMTESLNAQWAEFWSSRGLNPVNKYLSSWLWSKKKSFILRVPLSLLCPQLTCNNLLFDQIRRELFSQLDMILWPFFNRLLQYYMQHKSHLKGYSEILWAGVHFSQHILILLYILKELSYTNLTSIGFLQKQNGFDKIGRSVHFLNFYARA